MSRYEFDKEWLCNKFEEIRRRTLLALRQLDDDQVNWRPNEASLSISTLVKHIEGNIGDRIVKGILRKAVTRNRDEEFTQTFRTRAELEATLQERLGLVIETVRQMPDEAMEQTQSVRGRERTNLDMLHQCAAHYSEHMGQMLYIAKLQLQNDYKSTSL